jgi:microcystin-dependent protein
MVEEYLGAVKVFAGNYAIKGYAFCQGQLLPINQYTALFSLLGTTYGGNGVNNFQLPNLQSVLPLGWGNGSGLTPRVMGETGGVENVTLLSSSVPSHAHTFNASSTPTSTPTAGPTVLLGALQNSPPPPPPPPPPVLADGTFYAVSGTFSRFESFAAAAVGTIGGNLPHNNIQPSMGINYIICMSGIFPSRS